MRHSISCLEKEFHHEISIALLYSFQPPNKFTKQLPKRERCRRSASLIWTIRSRQDGDQSMKLEWLCNNIEDRHSGRLYVMTNSTYQVGVNSLDGKEDLSPARVLRTSTRSRQMANLKQLNGEAETGPVPAFKMRGTERGTSMRPTLPEQYVHETSKPLTTLRCSPTDLNATRTYFNCTMHGNRYYPSLEPRRQSCRWELVI